MNLNQIFEININDCKPIVDQNNELIRRCLTFFEKKRNCELNYRQRTQDTIRSFNNITKTSLKPLYNFILDFNENVEPTMIFNFQMFKSLITTADNNPELNKLLEAIEKEMNTNIEKIYQEIASLKNSCTIMIKKLSEQIDKLNKQEKLDLIKLKSNIESGQTEYANKIEPNKKQKEIIKLNEQLALELVYYERNIEKLDKEIESFIKHTNLMHMQAKKFKSNEPDSIYRLLISFFEHQNNFFKQKIDKCIYYKTKLFLQEPEHLINANDLNEVKNEIESDSTFTNVTNTLTYEGTDNEFYSIVNDLPNNNTRQPEM